VDRARLSVDSAEWSVSAVPCRGVGDDLRDLLDHRANLLYCNSDKNGTRFCEQSGQTVTSRGLRANSESLTVSVLNGDSLTVFCLTVSVLNGYRNGNTKSNRCLLLYVLRLEELVVFATRLRSVTRLRV